MIPMLRVFSRGNSRAISFVLVRVVLFRAEWTWGLVDSGRAAVDRANPDCSGARSGGAGPGNRVGPLDVTARSASLGRLPSHCSDHHVLIVPFGRSTSGSAQKPCSTPPFSED